MSVFDILKMCAMFLSLWVRKLIGKPRIPYNRGLRVRGSSHPIFNRDYVPFLSPFAAASKVFRIQSDLLCPACRIASLICRAAGDVSRTAAQQVDICGFSAWLLL